MLTPDSIVVDAGIKIGQFDSNIDWGNRVGTDKVDFGLIHLFRQLHRFTNQLLIQAIVMRLFAGKIDGDNGFTAFRPRLIFDHPDRARAFTQQMPVGWGENHGLQAVMLMRHFQHQIMLMSEHFLNDGLKGAVMPDHFDINVDTGIKISAGLLADPFGTLADDTLAHRRALIRRKQGGHFI